MKTITFDETKWKLVPVEPTEEMLAAVSWPGCARTDWSHMLAAAPTPPTPAAQSQPVTLTEEEILDALNETSMGKQAACGYPPAFALLELARAIIAAIRARSETSTGAA